MPHGKYCGRCQAVVPMSHRHKREHRNGSTRQGRKVRELVLDRDNRICWLCGKPGADSIDHVIPLVHGGQDTIENGRAAHLSCNSARGARAA